MVSKLASSNGGYAPHKRLMIMDVKRAFLHAPVTREIYTELPEEAKSEHGGDIVGEAREVHVRHPRRAAELAGLCGQSHAEARISS